MERNRLADILEKSLQKDNQIEVQTFEPPSAPKNDRNTKVFKFFSENEPSEPEILIPSIDPSESVQPHPVPAKSSLGTPKFSVNLSAISQSVKKDSNLERHPVAKAEAQPSKPKEIAAEKIIADDDEFEIDGMGEVWEYAGYSANVNEKDDSDDDSDEFNPEAVVKIKIIQKTQKKLDEPEKPPVIVQIDAKGAQKKVKKRVDLKTRGLQAQGKLQQLEMKEKPVVEEQKDPVKVEENVANVSNEWDSISIREIEEVKHEKFEEFEYYNRNITCEQVIQSIENIKIEEQGSPVKKSFFRGLFSCFRARPKGNSHLLAQRHRLFVFSKTPYDASQILHISMAKRIFKILRSADNCAVQGNHWTEIGFRGASPGLDLTNSGIYGLLSILYFLEKLPSAALQIYKSSLSQSSGFPFAAACLMLSEASLKALEENLLIKNIEKSDRVYDTILDFFCGLMLFWFKYYNETKQTVAEMANTRDYVWIYAKKHINEVLNLTKYRI